MTGFCFPPVATTTLRARMRPDPVETRYSPSPARSTRSTVVPVRTVSPMVSAYDSRKSAICRPVGQVNLGIGKAMPGRPSYCAGV
jgi:hypothetical protein